ncbi:MAG: FAD-dependent oxidoreductase [Rhodobacteraceae bacterium]|nr:FAD-dependent oxidoreductase [Paracoccaceae bacterium]
MSGEERIETDICVIGAGSGGLSVAAGAVQMGARVALVEKGLMGGDCLNYGCVPSKALIAAAKHAHAHRSGAPFGVAPHEPEVDFAAVNAHVRSVIAAIEPHDSQERFEGLGVDVIRAPGEFISETELRAGDRIIAARRFVIATGSRPFVPPIPGLETAPYLTNESLFDQTARPEILIIIGGGPIGMEMAQAHRRLGSKVVVIEAAAALGKDDPALASVVLDQLRLEGVEILENAKVVNVAGQDGAVTVTVEGAEGTQSDLTGTHLLVATGRAPNTDGLGLEAAGVDYDRRGIKIDARLRSSNKKIFAIGDIAGEGSGGLQFTHVAGYHAGIVIRNALFRWPAKAQTKHIPWVTFTDPELAHVGWTEAQARAEIGDRTQTIEWGFKDNDRAQAERHTKGLIKAVLDNSGRIHGASIVGPQAGELIQIWALALSKGLKIKDLTGMVAPYPTLGEVSKRAAGQFFAPKLFSDRTRGIVRFLLRFG